MLLTTTSSSISFSLQIPLQYISVGFRRSTFSDSHLVYLHLTFYYILLFFNQIYYFYVYYIHLHTHKHQTKWIKTKINILHLHVRFDFSILVLSSIHYPDHYFMFMFYVFTLFSYIFDIQSTSSSKISSRSQVPCTQYYVPFFVPRLILFVSFFVFLWSYMIQFLKKTSILLYFIKFTISNIFTQFFNFQY